MAINSRQKGAAGERELANILKDYGYNTRRGQQYSGLNGDADVIGLPGIHIEVKRVEKLNLDKAMEQSVRDSREGEIPTVFHRKNKKPWKVTMELDNWMPFYKAYLKTQESSKKLKSIKMSCLYLLSHEGNPDKERELSYVIDVLEELEDEANTTI